VNGRVVIAAAMALMAPALLAARSFGNAHPVAAAHGSWQVLNNCLYVSNASNDGDSFHVSAGGKQYLFRLYFVDAPETDAGFKDRVDEQAKYFGITSEQVIQVGKIAKAFTREKLAHPFTVRTCFQDALGRSRMERFYAIVQTPTGDLGEQLIENGLARIHGASANPVGLPAANVEWQKLDRLETAAKAEKVGGWGVNYGRMMARSEKSKNRAPVDPFEAFFHPERTQTQTVAASSANAWPFPRHSPAAGSDDIVTINPAKASASSDASAGTAAGAIRPIDINSASSADLENVPGIGPVLAQRIIEARPFKSADDLRNVKGIGEYRYRKLRPYFE